jgi:hypothetical protein
MRWILVPLVALALSGGPSRLVRAAGPEIWFNPINQTDWQNLFLPGAPWPLAMHQVRVITLEPQWIWGATDAQMLAVANFAKQNHMRLNMDVQAVEKIPGDSCGTNSEGYTWISDIQNALAPLVRLGIHLDSIHMDEPVWFGRYEPASSDGCNLDVATLVQRTAVIVDLVIAAYPGIRVVEIEPVPDLTAQSDWLVSELGFEAGLSALIGRPIDAMQMDVNWENPDWQTAVSTMYGYAHQKNMKLGIFYNGLDGYGTNAGWIAKAISNFNTIEGQMGLIPDQAIFGTWTAFPTNNLPETVTTTQTSLIDQYVLSHAHIQARFSGQSVIGQLTRANGKPIANATITGNVPGLNWSAPMPIASSVGVVPSNAVSALLGVRLNVECRCNGSNDVLLGMLHYQETASGSNQAWWNIPSPDGTNGQTVFSTVTVGGQSVRRITAPPGATYAGNSGSFAVTPGASFQFSAPAVSIGPVGWYGNLIVIWLDANGNGINRIFLVPNSASYVVSTATSDIRGRFYLPKMPRVGQASQSVSVTYGGGAQNRAAIWTP